MEIILVRHTMVDVAPGTCYGRSDVALRPTFPEEARKVKQQLEDFHPDAVYSSPLSRCRRLAEYCYDMPIIVDCRLQEMDFGNWEMQRYDEITDPRIEEWYADFVNVRATGGESFLDQQMRFRSFCEDLAKEKFERTVIFTHGGIMMQAMLLFRLATLDDVFRRQPPHGSILRITGAAIRKD